MGDMLELIYYITQKYTLCVPLISYDTLGLYIVDGDYHEIFLKHLASGICLVL